MNRIEYLQQLQVIREDVITNIKKFASRNQEIIIVNGKMIDLSSRDVLKVYTEMLEKVDKLVSDILDEIDQARSEFPPVMSSGYTRSITSTELGYLSNITKNINEQE